MLLQVRKLTMTETGNILIVDDEDSVRESLSRILQKSGYHVQTSSNGSEAIQQVKKEDFDLVITDLAMPKMMGYELAAEMVKIRSDIPIICSTGFNELANNKSISKPNFNNYLNKPITFDKLANVVHHTINQSLSN